MIRFPTESAHRLACLEPEHRWLVEDLWAENAVGIVGGEPKCCKSFLALDLAVSVSSGQPCLGRFAVARAGRVLLFAAEDAQHVVRSRLEGIARARVSSLAALDIHVITAPTVRLDLAGDRERLRNTVAALRPRLLLLDPFVRLHRIDENASGEVAPLLAFLRELNREHELAVALVHHAKKGGSSARAGQALRGSSEFHAWGDSNLYLRRRGEALELSVEHRAARSIADLRLELSPEEQALALRVVDAEHDDSQPLDVHQRVVGALLDAGAPLRVEQLRRACRMRTQTLILALRQLTDRGTVERSNDGYRLPS
jgi:RecA-family ATPase